MIKSKGILSFILAILISHLSSDLFSQNSDSVKCWSEKDRLKWSDFKGKIPANADSLGLHAVTSYLLTPVSFRENGILKYQIKLVFRKYRSWTAESSDSDIERAEKLLAHEQLHFDIGELYARKIRKAIKDVSETIRNPSAQDFRLVIHKLFLENAAVQNEYDTNTVHGLILESQIKWQKKIQLELEQLKEYASTLTDCG